MNVVLKFGRLVAAVSLVFAFLHAGSSVLIAAFYLFVSDGAAFVKDFLSGTLAGFIFGRGSFVIIALGILNVIFLVALFRLVNSSKVAAEIVILCCALTFVAFFPVSEFDLAEATVAALFCAFLAFGAIVRLNEKG